MWNILLFLRMPDTGVWFLCKDNWWDLSHHVCSMYYMIFKNFDIPVFLLETILEIVSLFFLILNIRSGVSILSHLNWFDIKKEYKIGKKEIIPVSKENLYFHEARLLQLNLYTLSSLYIHPISKDRL